jgi:hypothetical protein
MLKYYTYKVSRDYGFAPNPFNGVCTLATCKPLIRKHAEVGHYIIGLGSKQMKNDNTIVYAMQVDAIMSFNEYFDDPRFQSKKPRMNGSKKALRGDNIYYKDSENEWNQLHSHHSYPGGSTNTINLKTDTSADRVLISYNYRYFGKCAIPIPDEFMNHVYKKTQGCKLIKDVDIAEKFIEYIYSYYDDQKSKICNPGLFHDMLYFKGK